MVFADGLRTTKTVNGITTEYYWADGILYGQRTGSEYMLFLYDESGNKYGFILKNGTTEEYYYYTFNLQGDVIGIVDNLGNIVVEYTYGAWGDLLSVTGTRANTIGQANPIRYRGYYYDSETGCYLTNGDTKKIAETASYTAYNNKLYFMELEEIFECNLDGTEKVKL